MAEYQAVMIDTDEHLNKVAKQAVETELSGKFSLERLAASDEFIRTHSIFLELNSYLKAFDNYNKDYKKYISKH